MKCGPCDACVVCVPQNIDRGIVAENSVVMAQGRMRGKVFVPHVRAPCPTLHAPHCARNPRRRLAPAAPFTRFNVRAPVRVLTPQRPRVGGGR